VPTLSHYCSTKAALHTLSDALRIELAPFADADEQQPCNTRRLAENGGTPWYTSAEEFIRFRAANEAGFAPLIRASGARVE
jgi:NAD(P)-dependent dehydrogenase (short-subunit alcohol dehydrogenase family)